MVRRVSVEGLPRRSRRWGESGSCSAAALPFGGGHCCVAHLGRWSTGGSGGIPRSGGGHGCPGRGEDVQTGVVCTSSAHYSLTSTQVSAESRRSHTGVPAVRPVKMCNRTRARAQSVPWEPSGWFSRSIRAHGPLPGPWIGVTWRVIEGEGVAICGKIDYHADRGAQDPRDSAVLPGAGRSGI